MGDEANEPDPEFAAMKAIIGTFGDLDSAAAARVLHWAWDRYALHDQRVRIVDFLAGDKKGPPPKPLHLIRGVDGEYPKPGNPPLPT